MANMKKNWPFALSGLLMVAGIAIATLNFKKQIAQFCGKPEVAVDQVRFIWEWFDQTKDLPEGGGSIQCVGPSVFVGYRPLDIAAVFFVSAIALVIWHVGFRGKAETPDVD